MTRKITDDSKRKYKPRVQAQSRDENPLKLDGQRWDQDKVIEIFCSRIATSPVSACTVLSEPWEGHSLPTYMTVAGWLRGNEKFQALYAQAKSDQADILAEEMLEIADKATNDWMERNDKDNPGYTLNGEAVARSRLRIETRKWLAGKLRPKKYGEKIEHSGTMGVSVLQDFLSEINGRDTGLPRSGGA